MFKFLKKKKKRVNPNETNSLESLFKRFEELIELDKTDRLFARSVSYQRNKNIDVLSLDIENKSLDIEKNFNSINFLKDLNKDEINYLVDYLPSSFTYVVIDECSSNLNYFLSNTNSIQHIEIINLEYFNILTFYKFENLTSFSTELFYVLNSTSARKVRILYDALNLLPNLRHVERNQTIDSSCNDRAFDRIRFSFTFNDKKVKSNWFKLHSLIYKAGVVLESSFDYGNFAHDTKIFWLKEIKMNNCFAKTNFYQLKFSIDGNLFSLHNYF